jgi:hypothetical protein
MTIYHLPAGVAVPPSRPETLSPYTLPPPNAAHNDAIAHLSRRPSSTGRLEIGPIAVSQAVLTRCCSEGAPDARKAEALSVLAAVDLARVSPDDAARISSLAISWGGKVRTAKLASE